MSATFSQGLILWETFEDWELTNANITRYPGAVCVENKADGPGVAVSPGVLAQDFLAAGWRALGADVHRPVGSAFKFYFRVATTVENLAVASWFGPHDSVLDLWDEADQVVKQQMLLNLSSETERQGVEEVGPAIQVKVKIMPN